MNANMESILKGYKDPRLSRYFEPATGQGYSGEYRGIRQGTGFNHSRYSEHSRSTITQKTDAILMTPAEVWFLRQPCGAGPGRTPGLAMSKAYDHRSINGG